MGRKNSTSYGTPYKAALILDTEGFFFNKGRFNTGIVPASCKAPDSNVLCT